MSAIKSKKEFSPYIPSNSQVAEFTIKSIALGALFGFLILSPRSFPLLFKDMIQMEKRDRNLALGASLLGTFVSLSLYLKALKTAHVASLTAIAITLPVWVSLIEHIQKKEWPNRYLWTAFTLFVIGFALMNFSLDF